jgi:pimeloyl-ACP methyl ester carboxylesterase
MRLPAPLALLVAAGLLLLAAPSAGAAIAYAPCSAGSVLQCGSLDVPLDRSGAIPGTIHLAVARKVAPSNPSNTAVLGLAGGPGQAALPFVADFAELLAPALGTRDLLMFDQRGTGASSPLHCSLTGSSQTAAGTRCANQIGPSRGQYTTSASVDDIEALRIASGYDKLVLYGVSYGTKVALDYAARYPAHVAGLVLDSVVLPQGPDPLDRSTFHAMGRVLTDLCAGGECAGISGNPAGDLAARVRSLAKKPLKGLFTTGRGVREHVEIVRSDLFDAMLAGDVNPTLRAELPGALTSARKGDSAPLIRLVARSAGIVSFAGAKPAATLRQADDSDSDAVFAATLCEEGNFPWDRHANLTTRAQQINAAARAAGPGAFAPFDIDTALKTDMVSLCLGWPDATPAIAPVGPLPAVPTLVISGAADIRTPLEDANTIKTLIPGAQVLPVPYTGHSTLASDMSTEHCAQRGVAQFFAGVPVTPCAPSDNPYSPTPVVPTSFARLKATGHAGKVGRTITAALDTAGDMRRQIIGDALQVGQLPTRAGGLRGGRVVVHSRTLSLFDVIYVPGVKVSGSVALNGQRDVLTLSGPKPATGKITITPTAITGHLGGRKVNLIARSASVGTDAVDMQYQQLLRSFRLRHAG